MNNWKDWQPRIRVAGPNMEMSVLGVREEKDYFQAILAGYSIFGERLRIERESVPLEMQERLKNGVFPKSYLGSHADVDLKPLLKFGSGDIAEFVTWSGSMREWLRHAY